MGNSIVDTWMGFKKDVDTINREGYEWFMHFLFHPLATRDEYVARYQGKSPHMHLMRSVLWRLPLMIIPVLPALYIVNRTVGVLLNPMTWYKNTTKPLAMLTSVVAAALTFGAISKELHLGVSMVFQAPIALGILIAGGILLGAALMYGAKHFARWVNTMTIGTSNPKHHFNNTGPVGPFVPLILADVHRSVRTAHLELKQTLSEDPASLEFNAPDLERKPWSNGQQINNAIDATENAIEQGKELLGELEDIMENQKDNESITQDQAERVIIETGKPTLLRQWQAAVNNVRSSANPVILPQVKLDYDKDHSKIIERATIAL